MGSLTGAAASQRVAEAFKGWLASDGNRSDSVCAQASLTVRITIQAGAKAGVSDPLSSPYGEREWYRQRNRIKVTPGITGL